MLEGSTKKYGDVKLDNLYICQEFQWHLMTQIFLTKQDKHLQIAIALQMKCPFIILAIATQKCQFTSLRQKCQLYT